MSRFRASNARSAIDRQIHGYVAAAESAIQAALALCRQARRDDSLSQGHVARVRRDLDRCLGTLQSVRSVVPVYDLADPDLLSEDQLAALRRAQAAEVPEPEPEEELVEEDVPPPQVEPSTQEPDV